jgi:UDP:flavonoid glycosyltransferase YjiC (YdhE family)
MPRVLAYTSPARGHLYPIVPTLLELARRGHEVHVATLSSEVKAMQHAGLVARPISAAIEDVTLDDWDAASPQEGLANAFATFERRAAVEIPDMADAIDEVTPDFLLVDITTIGAAAVAESRGLPWAQWIPLFQHFSFDGLPPTHVLRVPFAIDPAGIDVLNAPRARLGLRPLTLESPWAAPLHLYLTAPPFEADGLEYPESFRLVGPCSWEPPAAPLAMLDDLEDPLVLVTASSEYQPDGGIIAAALAAMDGRPGSVVATTAAHDPAAFDPPDNARVARWLPHARLLERASVVVCHGGMGITQKALSAGVPVCVVPFGRDQFAVAGRVAASGAGTVVPPDQLTPETLRRAIDAAAEMRDGARRIAETFALLGRESAAADAIEALAAHATVR